MSKGQNFDKSDHSFASNIEIRFSSFSCTSSICFRDYLRNSENVSVFLNYLVSVVVPIIQMLKFKMRQCSSYIFDLARQAVWPDRAIYWTLGIFSKPLATINLPKSPTFLGKFSSKIIFGHFYRHLAIFSGHTGDKIRSSLV